MPALLLPLICAGVSLTGDPQLIAAVRAAAPTLADGAVPCVSAQVAGRAGGLDVELVDAHGRRAAHTVGSPETVASLVESWLVGDPIDPRLGPRAAPLRAASSAPTAPERGFELGAAAEAQGGDDGALWLGGRVWGCFDVGPTCLGVNGRFLRDPGVAGDSGRLKAHRSTAALLVQAAWPLQLGPVRLAPTLGVGVGLTSANTRRDGRRDARDGDVRTELAVVTSYPISRSLALDWAVGVSAPLFAHHGDVDVDGTTLPGAPHLFVGTSLGLSWGSR